MSSPSSRLKGSGGEGKSQIGAMLGSLFGSNMKDGSIGKISENRFARADLEHTLLMLKQGIEVVISQKNTDASCGIYGTDVLGLIQNDPRYASIIHDNGDLHNMPQKHLEHKLLTASAAVDGKKVTMLEDNGSVNAEAPLTVVNTRGFDLPKTGDNGTLLITLAGVLLMAGSVTVLLILNKKKLH